MRIVIAVLTILFVLLLISLSLLNTHERVSLSFGEGAGQPSREMALPWVLVGATLAGVVFMGIVSVLEGLHLRLANGRLRRQVQRLQEELDELRSLPLREPSAIPVSEPAAPAAVESPAHAPDPE
jgi:uncharacterized integral membrane protein